MNEFRIPSTNGEYTVADTTGFQFIEEERELENYADFIGVSVIPKDQANLVISRSLNRLFQHAYEGDMDDGEFFDFIPDFIEQINLLIYAAFIEDIIDRELAMEYIKDLGYCIELANRDMDDEDEKIEFELLDLSDKGNSPAYLITLTKELNLYK